MAALSDPQPFVSVIIPAIDEVASIVATIESTRCPFIDSEILLVDGGSTDETPRLAAHEGAQVLESPRRQRATQMNLGAVQARGEVLLFLHADTRLQPGALLAIREALRDPRVVGGGFVRRYDPPSLVLAATCRLATLRNRVWGWHLGDQAIFVRRHVFQRCGPYAEVDRFEDLDFSRRLGGCGKLVTLRPPVISSARRFQARGPLLTTLRDLWLTIQYLALGLPPARVVASPTGVAPRESGSIPARR